MQTVINKALKFINCSEGNEATTEELHVKYNNTPLNISINQKSKKTWEAVRATEPEHYNNLTVNFDREHTWFPKTSKIINQDIPDAIIIRQRLFFPVFSQSTTRPGRGERDNV